ncbi:MAG: hypothetical protein JO180_10980 [Gemmatirosa sp.]|nr:hypothetical protein [Gemmatirosa sp.]
MSIARHLTLLGAAVAAGAPLGAQRVTKDAAPATTYHVARTVRLGGPGGWDYLAVDTVGHRLYVSHATHVVVVDTRTDSVVGDIGDTPGVHGIAIAPSLGRGFVSNGRDSSVTVFDLSTLATVARIHGTGANPDAIHYDTLTHRVFTFNGRSSSATVIDAATDSIVGTIPLGGKPEFAVSDGLGMLWVNVEDTSELVAIDTRTLAITTRWSIKPCEEPSGLAIDRANRRLFSVCDDVMAVSDADAGKLLTTVKIGGGPDATAYDPALGLVFSSNGDGDLSVVRQLDANRYAVVQTLKTRAGARTMTLDPTTHRLYTVFAEYGPTPAATAAEPRPRAPMKPDSFTLMVIEP